MSALDWLVILAYLAVMLYIGYHSMKTVKTDEDFVLAGRNVGNIYIILSLFASFTKACPVCSVPPSMYMNMELPVGGGGLLSPLVCLLWV